MAVRKLKPIPKRPDEVVQDQITPYVPSYNKVDDTPFRENRGEKISLKGSKLKDFSVKLHDIDEAIKYYFDNIIRPSVVKNEQKINVPIIYGNQELWKTIQADGYYRDKNDKLMIPLIIFNRDSMEKNRTLGNKLDGNEAHLYQIFERKYNKQNYYDKFSLLTNRIPTKEYVATVVPDYVTLTYSCAVFTDYMEQLNPIIEAINFASDSYWGDLRRFKFRAYIDGFTNQTQLNIGEDRFCKANFTIKVYGYLIPDTINKQIASKSGKFYSKSQVVFGLETTTIDPNDINETTMSKSIMGSTGFVDSYNVSINNITQINADTDVLTYLNTNRPVAGAVQDSTTVIFNKEWISAPAALPATSVSNFMFFCNSQLIEASAIVSFTQGSGNSTLVVDTSLLGYILEVDDEVVGYGKFLA